MSFVFIALILLIIILAIKGPKWSRTLALSIAFLMGFIYLEETLGIWWALSLIGVCAYLYYFFLRGIWRTVTSLTWPRRSGQKKKGITPFSAEWYQKQKGTQDETSHHDDGNVFFLFDPDDAPDISGVRRV